MSIFFIQIQSLFLSFYCSNCMKNHQYPVWPRVLIGVYVFSRETVIFLSWSLSSFSYWNFCFTICRTSGVILNHFSFSSFLSLNPLFTVLNPCCDRSCLFYAASFFRKLYNSLNFFLSLSKAALRYSFVYLSLLSSL